LIEQLGIIGWGKIEPIILSALLAGEPILFVGSHGVNKTDGAQALSEGVLGLGTNYVKYETPIIQNDDILGYINAKDMMEGKLSYLQTPASLWAADAVGLDELNRANPMTAAKLMETVRTKSIMGMKTNLKLVFAMINPPQDYDTIYIDVALASRFVIIKVPGTKQLSTSDLTEIIQGTEKDPKSFKDFKEEFEKIQAVELDTEDKQQITKMVVNIGRKLKEVEIEPRELKTIAKLLVTAQKLKRSNFPLDEGVMADIILSKIPQAWGITRHQVDAKNIRPTLLQNLIGFALNDPLSKATTIEEVLKAPKADNLAWASALLAVISKETDASKLRSLLGQLNTVTNAEITNHCMQAAVTRILEISEKGMIPKDYLTWDREEMKDLVKEIVNA
jgi:MoxR-like ATPase